MKLSSLFPKLEVDDGSAVVLLSKRGLVVVAMSAANQRLFDVAQRELRDADGWEQGDGRQGRVRLQGNAELSVEDEAGQHPKYAPMHQVQAVADFCRLRMTLRIFRRARCTTTEK